MINRIVFALLLACLGILPGPWARAITWDNPLGGSFEDPGNWNTGTIPEDSDTVEFLDTGPMTVDFFADHFTNDLDVLGSNVTFNLNSTTYNSTGIATIDDSLSQFGFPGTRSLTVLGGNLNLGNPSVPFHVGGPTLGNAELLVGTGASVRSNGPLYVGGNNNIVGNSVTISDGATLQAAEIAVLGGTAGQTAGDGTLNVTGVGSQFAMESNLYVGGAGMGVLNASAGAGIINIPFNIVDVSASTIIANSAGSTGTVNLSTGATWNDPLGIDVGRGGNGFLNISSAAGVTSSAGTVARLPGSTGSVSIDGANSFWLVMGDITIGGTSSNLGGVGTVDVTNAARLESTGAIRVRSGSQLGGDATIEAPNIVVDAGARLVGTPTLEGNVVNSGTVAPGFSPGTMFIEGDFVQDAGGLLEIEVEGLTPGTEHDEIVISGNASLAGHLDVPVTSAPGFPEVNDEITFLRLTGMGGIMGQFDSFSSPNLATAAPGMALSVVYSPLDVKLRFVTPVANTFVPPPGGVGNWSDPALWSAGVPDTTSAIELVNETPLPQRLDVQFFPPANTGNAFAHTLAISGTTQSMTVAIAGGSTLSVTNSTVVGNKGVVDLTEGGALTTNCLHVSAGGLLTGIGTVNGNAILGSATGNAPAILSPGISTGMIEQNGDLQILSNGVVAIELVNGNAHDVLNVSGNVSYGGTLQLDATNYDATPPSPAGLPTFNVVTADTRAAGSVFEEVTVVNAPPGIGFDVIYKDIVDSPPVTTFSGPQIAAAQSVGSGTDVQVVGSYMGDMNWDGQLDAADDVPAFVLGLTDPFRYFTEIEDSNGDAGHSPAALGNSNGDSFFDFDDIDSFLAIHNTVSLAQIMESLDDALADMGVSGGIGSFIQSLQTSALHGESLHDIDLALCEVDVIPEPTTAWLLLIGCFWKVGQRRLREAPRGKRV